ncbi:radical SAM protein [candidate division KSB1 bacterium]|nr:radical SAM protein [candidate division KSB1 bacterium]
MPSTHPNILLINPWITDFAAYDFWLKPMGLLYLAAVLRREGYSVRLVDCMDRAHPALLEWQGLDRPVRHKWSTGKFVRTPIAKPVCYRSVPRVYARYGLPVALFKKLCVEGEKPDTILVTSGMAYWYPGVQEAIAALRELFPHTPILLGGIYATLCANHAREHSGADVVIAGEAEHLIGEAVEAAMRGNGVGGRLAAEHFALDDLPFPAFDLYPNLPYATIMTSRACPLKCTFCASRLVSGKYRWRSIENVLAELDWLHAGLGVREFAFYDDALLTNRDHHFLPLCEQMIAKKFHSTFHTPNGLQVKFMDAATAQLMWRAGFKTVRLAYESGSEERQRDMSKKVSNESFARGVMHLQAAGFGPRELDAYVIMALPGQALEEVILSMAYVHSLKVGIRLAAFSPIPGTVDFARAVARGEISADADPLLTNNSILPIHLNDENGALARLALLAKQLNSHLLQTGEAMDSFGDLVTRLQAQVYAREHWSTAR